MTPTFKNPPVVELILGAQFSPLTKLTSAHFGLLWNALGSDWVTPMDAPLIDDQYEFFDRPNRSTAKGLHLRLEPVQLPGRLMLEHRSKDRLIQFQSTRVHLNWRRADNFYPSYKNLITEFEETFALVEKFARDTGLGPIAVNQWEITYIDAFARGQSWQTLADWSNLLPGLFGNLFLSDGLNLEIEQRAAEWSFELKPKLGRIHISAFAGRWGSMEQESLLLNMTTRGPVGNQGVTTLREGLDLGHKTSVDTFLRVVDKNTQESWEQITS